MGTINLILIFLILAAIAVIKMLEGWKRSLILLGLWATSIALMAIVMEHFHIAGESEIYKLIGLVVLGAWILGLFWYCVRKQYVALFWNQWRK